MGSTIFGHAEAPVLLLSMCCGLVFGWQGFFWRFLLDGVASTC